MSSFPLLMIAGTIDCDADEQARSACGIPRNLDMFKAPAFMLFYAGMKLNAECWWQLALIKKTRCQTEAHVAQSQPLVTRPATAAESAATWRSVVDICLFVYGQCSKQQIILNF